jgi:hypothetical protein
MGASYGLQLPPGYVEQLQEEVSRYRGLMAVKDSELNQLRRNYKEYRQEHEILQHEHNSLSRQLQNTTSLSNARGKELAGAEAFLSKADNISVGEVRGLIEALNDEIFQAAASLGDCIVRQKYNLSEEDGRSSKKRLRPLIGKGLLHLLSTQNMTESHVNPLLVQVVAQVLLVDRCNYEVMLWDPNRSELSEGLRKLYRGMQVSGGSLFVDFPGLLFTIG